MNEESLFKIVKNDSELIKALKDSRYKIQKKKIKKNRIGKETKRLIFLAVYLAVIAIVVIIIIFIFKKRKKKKESKRKAKRKKLREIYSKQIASLTARYLSRNELLETLEEDFKRRFSSNKLSQSPLPSYQKKHKLKKKDDDEFLMEKIDGKNQEDVLLNTMGKSNIYETSSSDISNNMSSDMPLFTQLDVENLSRKINWAKLHQKTLNKLRKDKSSLPTSSSLEYSSTLPSSLSSSLLSCNSEVVSEDLLNPVLETEKLDFSKIKESSFTNNELIEEIDKKNQINEEQTMEGYINYIVNNFNPHTDNNTKIVKNTNTTNKEDENLKDDIDKDDDFEKNKEVYEHDSHNSHTKHDNDYDHSCGFDKFFNHPLVKMMSPFFVFALEKEQENSQYNIEYENKNEYSSVDEDSDDIDNDDIDNDEINNKVIKNNKEEEEEKSSFFSDRLFLNFPHEELEKIHEQIGIPYERDTINKNKPEFNELFENIFNEMLSNVVTSFSSHTKTNVNENLYNDKEDEKSKVEEINSENECNENEILDEAENYDETNIKENSSNYNSSSIEENKNEQNIIEIESEEEEKGINKEEKNSSSNENKKEEDDRNMKKDTIISNNNNEFSSID